jgi:hypothetical protein
MVSANIIAVAATCLDLVSIPVQGWVSIKPREVDP